MALFREEHRKLWKRSSVRISVILCFLYIIVFGGFLSYQWFQFGTVGDMTSSFGNQFNGYESIRLRQEYAAKWSGDLTDEKIQAMVREYQELSDTDPDKAQNVADWRTLNGWIETLWPELKDPEEATIMLSYVDPESLTGLYERRQNQINEFLDLMGTTEEEKAFFLEMNKDVDTPFQYSWTEGWSSLLGSTLADTGMVMGLFIAIILAPLFAGERQRGMQPLILTTKNGGRQTALAKAAAGFVFTLELFGLMAAGSILLQLLFMGTQGWNMPIQCVKMIATAPWNLLQAEIYEYDFALFGCLGYAGAVMLISSLCRSSFAAILSGLAVLYIPMAAGQYLPLGVQKIFDLIPLAGSSTDIFRTNVYHIFGKIIWSPYILLTVPFCIGILCVPVFVRCWTLRRKKPL